MSAPSNASAQTGAELVIHATAADPNGDPITSLVADLSNLPPQHGATFTVGSDKTSGTLRWTPSPSVPVGAIYRVTFTATNALSGSATTSIVILAPPPSPPSTVERRIAADADDAEERSTGTVDLKGGDDLELMTDGSSQLAVGLRFTQLAIPTGATITHAYVKFQADEAQSEPTTLTIRGQAIDNAPAFTNTSGSLTARMTAQAATTARVTWNDLPPWTTVGTQHETPELASVIQEIVARPGWRSGNALVLLINGTGHRTAESYEGDHADAPLLHVEYAAGAGLADVDPGDAANGTLPPDKLLVAWIVPNPLHDRGTLHYATRESGHARGELFDLNGRRVRVLLDVPAVTPGRYSVDLQDRDERGNRLPPGTYFYRVSVATATVSGRFLIMD